MATLYELTDEYRQLLEMMEDDTVDPEILKDTLEAVDGEIEVKADGCAKEDHSALVKFYEKISDTIVKH